MLFVLLLYTYFLLPLPSADCSACFENEKTWNLVVPYLLFGMNLIPWLYIFSFLEDKIKSVNAYQAIYWVD